VPAGKGSKTRPWNSTIVVRIQTTQSTHKEEKTKELNFPLRTKERWVSRNLGRAKEETGS